MTCEQAAWKVVARLEQHQEWLAWALAGVAFLAGLLLLTAIHAARGHSRSSPRSTTKEQLNVAEVASVCHEANRALCLARGDTSQPAWADAPDWQKESATNGVLHALNNPNAKPSDSHDSWLREKEAAGWKYGPVEDPEKKEHPCFVPYDQLPPEQQEKDALFLAVVRALR